MFVYGECYRNQEQMSIQKLEFYLMQQNMMCTSSSVNRSGKGDGMGNSLAVESVIPFLPMVGVSLSLRFVYQRMYL